MLTAYAPLLVVLVVYYLSALALLGSVEAQLSLNLVGIFTNLRLVVVLLAIITVIYGYARMVMRTGEPTRARLARWLRQTPFVEIALARLLPMVVLLGVLETTYLAFKRNIPALVPYSWDGVFAALDRLLFLGTDPWVLTHELLPWAAASQAIGVVYALWFYLIFACFGVATVMPLDSRLRLTFFLAFLLSWSVGGSCLAILFSSAGPVYVERLFGDPTFAPLMQRLADQNEVWEISALATQEDLWRGYADPAYPAMGISAFPSMHLCLATVAMLFGFARSRALGWSLVVFTGLMLFGSVHLGWHYAVDGIAGIALGLLFWWMAKAFAAWWLGRMAATAPVPAHIVAAEAR